MTILRHTTPVYDVSAIIEALKKDMLTSNCPEGCLRIDNLYYNPDTKEIVIETEDE